MLQPKPQSSLSVQLVFLASCEGETRLIVSTLLLQVPRGLVQVHQLLVPDFVFLPTPDLETCYNQPLQTGEGRKGLPCERVWCPYNCVARSSTVLGGGGYGGGRGEGLLGQGTVVLEDRVEQSSKFQLLDILY